MSIAFLVTALVVVATPGTGVLLSITSGLRRGPRHSLVTALGCTLGIVPHLMAAVTGAAALVRVGGLAFEIVRALGVAYLLFMAWSTWRDRELLAVGPVAPPPSAVRTVVSAVLANLLNPKLTLFFFAFLPQFVVADAAHPVLEMLWLSGVFMVMTFFVFALYGIFAGVARTYLVERPGVLRRLRQGFAVTFVGLAGKLAVTR